MPESLVFRVKRLVSGSINDLADALETANAEAVMREAVREIDRACDDVREELGQVIATRHQTLRLIERAKAKIADLEERAKVAVAEGRDDLAEAALSRQMDHEAEIPVNEARLADLFAKQTELDGYIAALAERKRQMEVDITAHLRARESAAEAAGLQGGSVANDAERRADKAQAAFDRAMNGPFGSPIAKADRETATKLHELDRLNRSTKVAERLASMKRGMQQVS
ncbi:MAG: PspA/IM30 family protein [Hyphomicrobiaceae bacterium]